jgi:hypothetical protein
MMQASLRRKHRVRKSVTTLLGGIATLGLCAFQFGDRNELNKMPFTEVQPLVSDLAKARRLAKQGNIDLLAGQAEHEETVRLRGEVTDANCYLGIHMHAYDHAFCAKLCAAAGGPLVFVPDQGGQVYLVLSEQNGIRLPENVLDRIGVPGIVVKGKVLDADGLRVLAVEGLVP